LEGGPPSFTRSSTSSVLLWYANSNGGQSHLSTGLSPSVVGLSRPFNWCCLCNSLLAPATPIRRSVWAIPLSLAATYGVSVDFLSCRYLDVSVPCVGFTWPIHSAMDEGRRLPAPNGFPHSDISGLTNARLLPRTYRSLPRPSSPLDTKTSPMHS
jgi:hypothetical protein